jgi:lipopolysaccharide biosynthesis glycosyltransferase
VSNNIKSVDVALCGDRRVLLGLAITVRSALENATCQLNIHVVSAGLRDKDKAKLLASWKHSNCGTVQFSDISRRKIQNFRSTAYLKSKAAYARYFIGEMFPHIDRCVYLDTDLMVFRDLKEAFQLDLGDKIAAAVRDIGARLHPINPTLKQRLGLRDERNYFNSGFMVIDFDAWRRESIVAKLVHISNTRFDALDSQDQDALNIALEDRVLLIDETWNTSQYEKPYPLHRNIVHLIGTVKPWHERYREKFKEPYYRDVIFKSFMGLLERTEFRDSSFGGVTEQLYQKIPTLDMIFGKIRRLAKSARF